MLQEEAVLKILESRKKYVDAVVITGGEPTINRDLPMFLRKLKEKGFAVKLDTNGFYPQVLEESLPYVDYIALDVKTSLKKYTHLGAEDVAPLLRTIEILKTGDIEYEFRTTVVPGIVDREDIIAISELVNGAENFVLQQFNPEDTLDKTFRTVKPYSTETITGFSETMKNHVGMMTVRA